METPMRNNKTMMRDNITLKKHIDKTKATRWTRKKIGAIRDSKGSKGT
jgi:hypothetical protein